MHCCGMNILESGGRKALRGNRDVGLFGSYAKSTCAQYQ